MDIDFNVMGFKEEDGTSKFLNWCMHHRDNLEFVRLKKTMDLKSASAEMHFTDLGVLMEIYRHEKDKR